MRVVLRTGVLAIVIVAVTVLGGSAQGGNVGTGTLVVTKAVVGDAPPGTTYEVGVLCEVIDVDTTAEGWDSGPEGTGPVEAVLQFGENGGAQSVSGIRYDTRVCTVSESDDGGAHAVDFALVPTSDREGCILQGPSDGSAAVQFTNPVTCELVVTNQFPADAQPADVARDFPVQPAFTG